MWIRRILTVALTLVPASCDTAFEPESRPMRFSEVAAGDGFTCATAATVDDTPYCWGVQTQARLGTDRTDRFCDGALCLRPVPIQDPMQLHDLSAGASHACGLADSSVYCWGWNRFGQLGDARTLIQLCPQNGDGSLFSCSGFPSLAALGLPVRDVTAGPNRTCALTADGAAYCWGRNHGGQLGIGVSGDSVFTPRRVPTDRVLKQVSAGLGHTCAVAEDGSGLCWGVGSLGRLGTGSDATSLTPALVVGDIEFTAVDAGGGHTCAIASGGAVYCWGWGSAGQLGSGAPGSSAEPVQVVAQQAFMQVSTGYAHSCGVSEDGVLFCWGANQSGQLGIGTTTDALLPTAVLLDEPVRSVSAGTSHTCAVTRAERLFCWGSNGTGQLGTGTTGGSLIPVQVSAGG